MNDPALLLDTHCWLWAQLGLADRMSRPAISEIRSAASTERLLLSVISVWELTMLERSGLVVLPRTIRSWVDEALAQPGLSIAPLTPEIMIESVHLPGELHGDPPDRMIVATARVLGATLVTKDRRLIEYSESNYVRVIRA